MEANHIDKTDRQKTWPARFVTGASLIAGATCSVVLAGSVFGVAALTTVIPGGSRMTPATAFAFLLAGTSLYLTRAPRFASVAVVCAFFSASLGALRLAAHVLGWGSSLDTLGLPQLLSAGAPAGQMSPGTALNFALLGSALILAQHRRASFLFMTLTVTALLVGWLGLTRYLYGGQPLMPLAAMAVHTAVLFLILSAGVAVCRPDTGLMRLLASDSAGGTSARRLLPAALVLPLALAWVPVYAGHRGWLDHEAALAVFALLTVIVFGALIWSTALALERTDIQREHAEDAFRASEEQTRLIIDSALDAVISIDSAGIVRGWNPQARTLFGWTREEAAGRSLADLIIPEQYREAHQQGLRRFLETGEARVLNQRVELVGRRRNGDEFPVEIAITPIRADSGIVFSAFVQDITGRRHAENVLRESEQRLRTLAESLPHLVWTCRPDGWCDYLSRQWLDYTGRGESEQLGYGWAEQLHPDDRERVSQEWGAATRRGDSFDTEFRIRRGDGAYRWFKTRAVPLRDGSGDIVKWFGSNTDMEDYKAAERKQRTQLERMSLLDRTTRSIGERQDSQSILQVVLRSLEDDLPIDFGCVCLRETGQHALTITCVGSKSRRIAASLGLTERTAIVVDENGLSRCLRGKLVYEPDITQAVFAFPRRLAEGGLGSLVIAPLTVESKVFGVLIAARRETNRFESGECEFLRQLSEHVALTLHQAELYTALQRAYEDIRRTQQTVVQQERLRALGQMAGGIAHDINNSLSSASLYVDALLQLDDSVSESTRADLAVVQRALADVANTVARMREFYRPQEPALAHHRVNLNELIEQVVNLTRARWSDMPQERGAVISVHKELAPRSLWVRGSESDIRDALTNLVLNAVDAMPEGGRLTLRTRGIGNDRASVEVVDTGAGMSEEVRTRCLEPFFTTKGERGTGLGLAMVYGMVERHGADLQIDSEPGRGTTMQLVFPAATSTSDALTGSHPILRPQKPLRILLVDDDPTVLKSLREVLERDGHCVTAADGGREGIAAFRGNLERSEPFAIVITDLGMPNVDGRSVAAAIKADAAQTPVVLLTGWGQRFLVQNDVPPFVDRVLSKPAKLSDIRLALAELVGE